MPENGAGQVALASPLKNSGAKAERLLGASTPMAASVTMLDGKGKPGSGFTIPARGGPTLSCKRPAHSQQRPQKALTAYDDFALTLRFASAGSVKVDVLVGPAARLTSDRRARLRRGGL